VCRSRRRSRDDLGPVAAASVVAAVDTDELATTQWADNQSAVASGRSVVLKALEMRSVAAAAAVTLQATVSVAAAGDRWV